MLEKARRAKASMMSVRARTMRMGKTMPMRPLVRTLSAQQAAKAQQRSGFGVDSVDGEGVRFASRMPPLATMRPKRMGHPELWLRLLLG